MREGVGAVLRHVDCPEGSGPVEHSQEGQAMNRTVLGGAVRGRGGRARGCEIDQGAVLWRVYARSVGKQPWNVSLLPSQSWGTTPVQIPDRCSNIEVEVGQGRVSREAS